MAALFVLSGAAGLALEVVWLRQLGALVGHGGLAMGLVVAAFLLGMVLGAWRGGPLADRARDPVALYAALEAVTAASALAVTAVLSRAPELSAGLASAIGAHGASLPLRALLAFALLLVPTSAMGATLPALTRHLARDPSLGGRSFAALYALNTLGAALGCALTGFVLLGRVGLARTALLAVAVDALVAALAWGLRDGARDVIAPRDLRGPAAPRDALAVAALSGFAALACEALWFRVLHAFVKSSTYAFTLLLTTYLTGVVLGGAFAARAPSRATPWRAAAEAFAFLAAAVVASVAVLGRAASVASWLRAPAGGDSDAAHLLLGAAVVLAPTALMGVAWPRVVGAVTHGLGAGVGRAVGALSAANTLGGAAGALLTTLVMIPALGVLGSFVAVTAGYAVAVALSLRAAGGITLRGDDGRAARVAALSLLALCAVPRDYLRSAVSAFPRARVIEVREGRDGTAAVLQYDRASVCAASRNRCQGRCARDFAWRQLIFGTVSYASTIPPAKRYMRALAHLPMLLRDGATRAVVICFGTGTTAGAFAAHPRLRALTLVDINRDVFSFARHFEGANGAVLRDPRVTRVVEDGRHFLATRAGVYDVISLEPPPPTAEGAASLYTVEFYEAARARLAPGGVVAQWIPLDQQVGSLDRAMLAAITARFRHVQLWIPARNEGVILASDAPLALDLARWRARWTGAVREGLADAGFPSPEALLGTLVLDDAAVRAYVAGAAPMTDDLPSVEFYRSARDPIFRVDDVLRRAADPRAEGMDVEVVRSRTTAERLGMQAWDAAIHGDRTGANDRVAAARAMVPADPWWDYLGALEYGCLDLDDP